MEVLFNPHIAAKRRKSSMVSSQHTSSSCFVHEMLEARRFANKHNIQKLVDSDLHSVDAFTDEKITEEGASRIMTKKQLSDMALGVRELSKYLGKCAIIVW